MITELSKRRLAYLHLIEPRASSAGIADDASVDSADNASLFRGLFAGPVVTAGGYTAPTGAETISSGLADAVAFGRMFIANPDLVERIRKSAPLNVFDRATSYGGGARGYKAVEHSFHEAGIMIRISGDTIELTPPLIISENQIGEIVDKVGQTIKAVA